VLSFCIEGDLIVETYPLLLTLGVAASFLWLALTASQHSRGAQVDAGLAALAGGLLGARLAFVLSHPSYYGSHLVEALWFWQGGLSWAGGAAGAFAGVALLCLAARRPLWPVTDALALPAAIISLATWAGCWADGCAYGRRLVPGPLSPPSADFFGGVSPRWPTQGVGVLLSLGAVALAYTAGGHKSPAGVAFGLTLSVLAAGSLALAFARGDPGPSLAGLRADALGSAAVLLASAAITAARLRAR
jgi:phosphatidylglycerol:prolipoprotein diacylglycerol transferase